MSRKQEFISSIQDKNAKFNKRKAQSGCNIKGENVIHNIYIYIFCLRLIIVFSFTCRKLV